MRAWTHLCAGILLCATVLAAGVASGSQTCREWWRDHEDWKARALSLYLSDASQRELDAAMFEIVQLEAYLTACAGSVAGQRERLVSHRTLQRPVDEYAAVVPESLLDQAGFDLSLDTVLLPAERGGAMEPRPRSELSAR